MSPRKVAYALAVVAMFGGAAIPAQSDVRRPGSAPFDELRASRAGRGTKGTRQQQSADGADLMRARCLTCHGPEMIRQQRLSRDGWARELDKMAGWGAVLDAADRDPLLDYLTTTFGPGSASPGAAVIADPGASLMEARCVVCHDARLIEQQRLDAEGWRREVDKMVGWGAAVSPQEKEPLVAYLARRYR